VPSPTKPKISAPNLDGIRAYTKAGPDPLSPLVVTTLFSPLPPSHSTQPSISHNLYLQPSPSYICISISPLPPCVQARMKTNPLKTKPATSPKVSLPHRLALPLPLSPFFLWTLPVGSVDLLREDRFIKHFLMAGNHKFRDRCGWSMYKRGE